MANGILDFLNTPDAQLGIGLLAAGGPTTDPNQTGLGQRVAGAMANMTAQQQQALRAKLMQSQVDENASQNLLRQSQIDAAGQKQKLLAQYMGRFNPATTGAVPSMPGSPATGGAPGGMGGDGKGAPPASAGTAPQGGGQGGFPLTPNDIAMMKLGGLPDLADAYKLAQPNWQNVNGNMVNTNDPSFKGGFQPGMSTSANGQVTQWQPDGKGGLMVGAPAGALDTFGAYQNISNRSAAAVKPIKVFNNATKQEDYSNDLAVSGGAPAAGYTTEPQMKVAAGGGGFQNAQAASNITAAADREIKQVQNDLLTKPLDQSSKAQLQAHLTDLISQRNAVASSPSPTSPAAAGFSAGPSARDTVNSKFNEKMAGDQGEILTKGYNAANEATNALASIAESRKAIQGGSFQGTGADAKLAVYKFGQAIGIPLDPEKTGNTDYLKSTLGNSLLEKAKTLGSNPSNADASRITDIVGSIGKDPGAMNKILDWQAEMATKAITSHNTRVDQATNSGFQSQFDMHVKVPEMKTAADSPKAAPKVFDALPTPNGSNKGQRIRDTTTGKILISNGLQWKEQ